MRSSCLANRGADVVRVDAIAGRLDQSGFGQRDGGGAAVGQNQAIHPALPFVERRSDRIFFEADLERRQQVGEVCGGLSPAVRIPFGRADAHNPDAYLSPVDVDLDRVTVDNPDVPRKINWSRARARCLRSQQRRPGNCQDQRQCRCEPSDCERKPHESPLHTCG